MMRKLFAILLTVALLAVAGCSGQKSSELVTITYWHTYNTDSNENRVLMEEVIPAFQAKFPHIRVEAVVQPYDGLHDSLVTGVAGGHVPDVMRMDIIWVPEFAKLGALEALDSYPGFKQVKSTTFPGPLATNFLNGKYYGLPLSTNTQVFTYHTDALAMAGLSSPPKTMDEFRQYAAAFKGKKDRYAFAPGGPYTWAMLPWFWSLGGRITNDDYTKASGFLNGAGSVAALEAMAQLYKDGVWAPTLLGGQPGTWDGFKTVQYGAVLEGPWFNAILGGELGTKMVSAPLPAGPGGSISVVGGEDIVIFASSKRKQAAWEFVKFALSDQAQIAMAKTGQMPVTTSASASDVMKQTGYYEAYVTQLATAMPRTPVPAWNKIDSILGTAFESVFRGEAPAKQALDRAAAEIDGLLGK